MFLLDVPDLMLLFSDNDWRVRFDALIDCLVNGLLVNCKQVSAR